jgi:hypothetical protein
MFIILFASNILKGQDEDNNKNAIYMSVVTAIFTNQFSFSYERTVNVEEAQRFRIKVN